MQAPQINIANLQKIHNFLRQKNVLVPQNFCDFAVSLATHQAPRTALARYFEIAKANPTEIRQLQQLVNGFVVLPNLGSLTTAATDSKLVLEQDAIQSFHDAFTDGSTKSIASMIDSTPANYLPIGLGKQLKNIEQTFGLKTLQSLGQIAKLETHNFEAVLKKILRNPNIVNHSSLGPNSSFLQKLNALCGILTHDPEGIRLSGLLKEDLGIPDHQLEALIKLRIKDKFSIHRINLKDAHNPDMVVFKQDNTYLDLMPINYPSQQALRVCQKMHAKNAHLEVIKDFIRKTEPQVLVDFIEIILRGDDINEESIKNNPEQTIVNLFKNKQIGTSKLLQNVSGDFADLIPKEVYSAFIKLQLESNNFSVDKLQKRPDGTGEVTLKNTLSSSTRPTYVRCASDSYALLEAIQRQQVS